MDKYYCTPWMTRIDCNGRKELQIVINPGSNSTNGTYTVLHSNFFKYKMHCIHLYEPESMAQCRRSVCVYTYRPSICFTNIISHRPNRFTILLNTIERCAATVFASVWLCEWVKKVFDFYSLLHFIYLFSQLSFPPMFSLPFTHALARMFVCILWISFCLRCVCVCVPLFLIVMKSRVRNKKKSKTRRRRRQEKRREAKMIEICGNSWIDYNHLRLRQHGEDKCWIVRLPLLFFSQRLHV